MINRGDIFLTEWYSWTRFEPSPSANVSIHDTLCWTIAQLNHVISSTWFLVTPTTCCLSPWSMHQEVRPGRWGRGKPAPGQGTAWVAPVQWWIIDYHPIDYHPLVCATPLRCVKHFWTVRYLGPRKALLRTERVTAGDGDWRELDVDANGVRRLGRSSRSQMLELFCSIQESVGEEFGWSLWYCCFLPKQCGHTMGFLRY